MWPARASLALTAAAALLTAMPGTASAAQPATWNFTQADVPAAQPLGNYGRGILVAVVDTWVDPNDAQFGGRVVDEADCLPGSCADHQYAPDSCVHGTHVAGTIASADYGVAPEADILAVQVLSGPSGSPDPSASCSGAASTVAAGIDFAVAKGARVINLSVGDAVPGVFQSAAMSASVANAANHGVVVVFAAGNQGVPLTDSYGKDALLVAATGPSGQLAGYSNFNTALTGAVNVAAPGGDTGSSSSCSTSNCVLSTFPGNRLGLLQGTSMAAPHVTGLAALLLAQSPGRGLSNVVSTIESTAKPLAGAGAGLVEAGKALEADSTRSAVQPLGETSTSNVPGGLPAPPPSGAHEHATVSVTTVPYQRRFPPDTQVANVAAPIVSEPTSTTSASASRPPSGRGTPQANRALSPQHASPSFHRSTWLRRNALVEVVACSVLAADLLALLTMSKPWPSRWTHR